MHKYDCMHMLFARLILSIAIVLRLYYGELYICVLLIPWQECTATSHDTDQA